MGEAQMFIRHSRMTEKQLNRDIKKPEILMLPFEVRRGTYYHIQLQGVHDFVAKNGVPKTDDMEDMGTSSEGGSDGSDTESENDADRQRRIQRMPAGKQKKVELINDSLIKQGLFLIMLDEPYKPSDSVASVTRVSVLKRQ